MAGILHRADHRFADGIDLTRITSNDEMREFVNGGLGGLTGSMSLI